MRDYSNVSISSTRTTEKGKPRNVIGTVLVLIAFIGVMRFLLGNFISRQRETGFLMPIVYESSLNKDSKANELLPVEMEVGSIDDLKSDVNDLIGGKMGTYGWYVESLSTGSYYGDNYDFSFTAASVNKVPIVISFIVGSEAGMVDLEDEYILNSGDKEEGTGSLQYLPNGGKYTYRKLIELIGKESDNTAVNALVAQVGAELIQENIDKWGMVNSDLEKNWSSPRDMTRLFSKVYKDEVFEKLENKEFFFNSLTDTDFEDRITLGVPTGIRVVHKIGNQIQVWNDCGIVYAKYPYAICIMTDGVRESEAQEVLPQISKLVWDWENRL